MVGFDGVECSKFVSFLASNFRTQKKLFRKGVRKALEHKGVDIQKSGRVKRGIRSFVDLFFAKRLVHLRCVFFGYAVAQELFEPDAFDGRV